MYQTAVERMALRLPLLSGIRSALATIQSNLLFGEDNGGVLTETITGKTQIGALVPGIEKSEKTEELDPAYEKALRRFLSHCRKKHSKTNIPVREIITTYISCMRCVTAECDKATLRRALERTKQKRGSRGIRTDCPEIIKEIRESVTLCKLWEKYLT